MEKLPFINKWERSTLIDGARLPFLARNADDMKILIKQIPPILSAVYS